MDIRKINRKGDLFDNVGSTIIAVIGLMLILVAAWKLYSVYINQEERNAQHLIDSIVGKIDTLEDGQTNKLVFGGFKSSGNKDVSWIGFSDVKIYRWRLVAWSKNELTSPDKCYFKSCICICPDIKLNSKEKYTANCQSKGLCRLFEQEDISLYTLRYLTISDADNKNRIPAELLEEKVKLIIDVNKIKDGSAYHYATSYSWSLVTTNLIDVPENLFELKIEKEKNRLNIVDDRL